MALLFCDSFDHYAIGDINEKWTSGSGSISIGSGRGRFGGNTLLGQPSNNGSYTVTWVNPAGAVQTWIMGMAFRVSVGAGSPTAYWRISDGGTIQIEVRRDPSTGKLLVYRGGSTLIATGTTVIREGAGDWYFIEIKAKIDNTTGTVEVRVNGNVDSTFSGDTAQTANNSADRISIAAGTGISTNITTDYDDLYVADTTGTLLNDFIGDCRVLCLMPNGDGATSQLVGSDGNSVNNSLLVDETAPNDDTDYVESSTVGDKDTYAYGDIAQSGSLFGVQILTSAKKTDAGVRSIRSIARLSGTEVESADFALGATYTYYREVRETKPGGGNWTVADVNNAEFGVKVTA